MCMSEEAMDGLIVVGAIGSILKRAKEIGVSLPVPPKEPIMMDGRETIEYCIALLAKQDEMTDEDIISRMKLIRRKTGL